jgi:hypothetical protein
LDPKGTLWFRTKSISSVDSFQKLFATPDPLLFQKIFEKRIDQKNSTKLSKLYKKMKKAVTDMPSKRIFTSQEWIRYKGVKKSQGDKTDDLKKNLT